MQPEIKATKYYGYDKMFYYEKLIKQYIDMSTNANESISKANVQAIYEIKTVIEDNLKPILAKFAIFWVICNKSGDYTSYIQYKTVVNSLKSQKKFLRLLLDTLKKSKIDNDMYKIIHKNEVEKVLERCNRLEKTILPELIKGSDIELYLKYMESKGKSFEEEVSELADKDFDDVAWQEYVDKMQSRVKKYYKSLSEDEKEAFELRRADVLNAKQMRKERESNLRKAETEEKLKSANEDIKTSLNSTIYNEFMLLFSKDPIKSSKVRTAWGRLDEAINKIGIEKMKDAQVCVIARHRLTSSGFAKSNIRINRGKTHLVTLKNMQDCTFYIRPFDDDKIKSIIDDAGTSTIISVFDLPNLTDYVKVKYINYKKNPNYYNLDKEPVSKNKKPKQDIIKGESFIEAMNAVKDCLNIYNDNLVPLRECILTVMYCSKTFLRYALGTEDKALFAAAYDSSVQWLPTLKTDCYEFDLDNWVDKLEDMSKSKLIDYSYHFSDVNLCRKGTYKNYKYTLSRLLETSMFASYFKNICSSDESIFINNINKIIPDISEPTDEVVSIIYNTVKGAI